MPNLTRLKSVVIKFWPFIAIFIFSLIYVERLFFKDFFIYGEEMGFLNFDYINFRHIYIWDFSHNFGSVSTGIFNQYTNGLIWKFGNYMKFPLLFIEQSFYFLVIFATLISSYLSFNLISGKKYISIILSFLYLTTFFFYASITTSPKLLHYLILPTSILWWLKYIKTNNPIYIAVNSVVLLLTLSIAINPPQLAGAYLFVGVYLFTYTFKTKYFLKAILFFVPYILTLFFVFSLNLLVISNSNVFMNIDPFQLTWTATNSRLRDIYRLFGAWWDGAGNLGMLYNHLHYYYHTAWGVFITSIPFLLLLLTMALSTGKKHKRNLLNILVLIVFFIFLVKGSTPPFVFIFDTLFKINVFKIFREPWAKFMPNFIFSMYLGFAYLLQKNWFSKFATTILTLMLIYQVIPLLQGRVIDHRNIEWKLSDVRIPRYWEDIRDWSIQNAKDKRILVLPINLDKTQQVYNNWSPYTMRSKPEEFFLYANTISDQYLNKEDEFITQNFISNLSSTNLDLGSIDYILNKKDIITESQKLVTIDSLIDSVDVENKLTFGLLDVYPVQKKYKSEKITTVSSIVNVDNFCDYSHLSKIDASRSLAYVQKQNLNIFPIVTNSDIKVTKINPTDYKVIFNDSPKQYTGLVFNESYNKGWRLYNSNSIFAKTLSSVDHYPVNCYKNLWILPHEVIEKNPTLYIRYQPQLLFNLMQYGYFGMLIMYPFLLRKKLNWKIFINLKSHFHSWIQRNKLKYFLQRMMQMTKRYLPKSQLISALITITKALTLLFTLRIFLLYVFQVPTFSNLRIIFLCILFLITWVWLRLKGKYFIFASFCMHILTIRYALLDNIVLSEVSSNWVYIFLILAMIRIGTEVFISSIPPIKINFITVVSSLQNLLQSINIVLVYLHRNVEKIFLFIDKRTSHRIPLLISKIVLFCSLHINNIYLKHIYKYYIFLKLIKSSKKSSYSLANLRKVIKEADIPVNKIILHFIYIVAVAVLIGVFSYVHYLNNQYRNRLSRNFHITSINPSNASQARKVNLKGYHFGIKSDDAYKVNSDQGYITEIKKWDEDNVEFIVPLTTDPGKLKIWIERPVDELHREQGVIVSNPVVLGVYSRFLIYPEENDTLTDRIVKKLKNFSFYNLNMFNSFLFKTYK